jgi:hypothetical protein
MSGIGDLIAAAGEGSGKLQKLVIESYADMDLKEDKVTFTAYYNPASFTTTYGIEYDEKTPMGQTKYEMPVKSYTPVAYSFELLLDGTGASIPTNAAEQQLILDVDNKIELFLQATNSYDGTIHRARYLKLVWGKTMVANVVLTGLTITKDLFDPKGSTLRAKLACSFKEFSETVKTKAVQQSQSPDMTHIRVVQQGDRLPLMCERIYGDAKLYLEVARYNKLSNYRNLVPGQKIYFPPLLSTQS